MRCLPSIFTSVCVAFTLALGGCSQSLFFRPDRVDRGSPAERGLRFVESDFASADGTPLSGWFIPTTEVADPRMARGTVVHFHGNAENITSHWRLLYWLPGRGFNVFVFDYRGYGRSGTTAGAQATPTPEGLAADSVAALQHVASLPEVDPSRIVVLGQSLGGTNAIVAVAHPGSPPVKAIAIEATFRSYSSIANEKLPFAGSAMDDTLSAERHIAQLPSIPILLLHGEDDRTISVSHSQRLYALAREPKRLVIVPDCGHLEVFHGPFADQNRSLLEEFFLHALDDTGDVESSSN